jgi:hypothetical protein
MRRLPIKRFFKQCTTRRMEDISREARIKQQNKNMEKNRNFVNRIRSNHYNRINKIKSELIIAEEFFKIHGYDSQKTESKVKELIKEINNFLSDDVVNRLDYTPAEGRKAIGSAGKLMRLKAKAEKKLESKPKIEKINNNPKGSMPKDWKPK